MVLGIPKSIKSFYFDPYNNLANAYSLIGETDLAINILSQSIKFNPYLPEPYNNLGMFYLKQKNLDLAEKAFLNTLKIRPHHGKAMLNIAKVYLLKNKPSIALSFLDQSCSSSDLDSDPAAYIKALNIYTETCIKENDFEKAIKAYKYWIKYEPRNLKALFNLAGAYTLVKDYENAIYIYEKLLSLNPNEIKIMGNLSELYILSNQINKANNIINKALRLSPNSPGLLLQKAKVLINLNKNLEAQVILTRLENSQNTPGFIKNIINQIKIN